MILEQRSILDRENEKIDAAILALPPGVRQAVESMRLSKPLARAFLDLEAATNFERLAKAAAEANAYAFAAWYYEEISEEQWYLLRDHAVSSWKRRKRQ